MYADLAINPLFLSNASNSSFSSDTCIFSILHDCMFLYIILPHKT